MHLQRDSLPERYVKIGIAFEKYDISNYRTQYEATKALNPGTAKSLELGKSQLLAIYVSSPLPKLAQ